MLCEGITPNEITFSSILKGCGSLENLQEGKRLHALLMISNFESVLVIQNALLDMYFKCGYISAASDVFKSMSEQDLVSWNAMITGYAEHGLSAEAFRVFQEMQSKNIDPDEVSFLGILKACRSSADLSQGKYIHSLILKSAMKNNALILNSLINMYAKSGCLEGARQVFDALPERDWVSWTVMITNYTEHEQYEEAFKLFSKLIQEGMEAKEETYVSILRACSSLAALEEGQKIHSQFVESGLNSHLIVEGHLVDMYAKCGSLEDAQNVCVKMSVKDLGSWTRLIVALAQHGNSNHVLWIFDQLLDEAVKLDHVAFLGILKACSNAGLLHEGCQIFDSMRYDHGITPSSEHCACMVDLLCRVHGDVILAKLVAEQILELEPENIGALVTLINICSTSETLIMKLDMNKIMSGRPVWEVHIKDASKCLLD